MTEDSADEFGLTDREWKMVNKGGKPQVELDQETGLTTITYSDGTTITSHKSVKDYGFEYRFVKGINQTLMLPVALVRAWHGDPCEKQSRQAGGDGYPRKK